MCMSHGVLLICPAHAHTTRSSLCFSRPSSRAGDRDQPHMQLRYLSGTFSCVEKIHPQLY
jgi:hypothetical protein